MINNIKSVFAGAPVETDRGTIVETVLLIAVFAIAALLVGNWISTAVINAGAGTAQCIQDATGRMFSGDDIADDCATDAASLADANDFRDSDGWNNRF